MGDRLSADLLARLKARAENPAARSDQSGLEAGSISADDMLAGMPKSDDPAVREYLEGMNTPFAGMISNMATGDGSQAKGLLGALGSLLGGKGMMMSMGGGTVSIGGSGEPTPAAPPATEAEVAAAEATLGFALPGALRRFYLEVADGGVGPGGGVYSLAELVATHREPTKDAIGPQAQQWPANLLPIQGEDWDLVAIDRDTERLVFWDIEDLTDEEDDPDNAAWDASFVAEAESLEEWLTKWLDRPSVAERLKRDRDEVMSRRPYTQEELEEMAPEIDEWQRRAEIYSMTPEERAAIGLPETGWEDKVWEGFDFDKAMKKPGK